MPRAGRRFGLGLLALVVALAAFSGADAFRPLLGRPHQQQHRFRGAGALRPGRGGVRMAAVKDQDLASDFCLTVLGGEFRDSGLCLCVVWGDRCPPHTYTHT